MGTVSSIRRTLAVFAVGASAALAGCSDPFSTDDGTHIRLRNASSFDFTSVTFTPGTSELKFPRIAPGTVTDYVPVANAYRYGYLDLLVDGVHQTLQPIDYVGESFIGEGRFTYVITIDPTTRIPSVALVED